MTMDLWGWRDDALGIFRAERMSVWQWFAVFRRWGQIKDAVGSMAALRVLPMLDRDGDSIAGETVHILASGTLARDNLLLMMEIMERGAN